MTIGCVFMMDLPLLVLDLGVMVDRRSRPCGVEASEEVEPVKGIAGDCLTT